MAQKVRVELVSDLSQVEADETVKWSLDGISYEIDLTSAEASELRDLLARYSKAGRRIGGRRQSGGGGASRGSRGSSSGLDLNEVRAWLKAQGETVSERGRIKNSLMEKYKAAHGLS